MQEPDKATPAPPESVEPPAPPLPAPPPVGSVRHGPLPDLATRIAEAQRQARQRRVEQGLPAEADDGGYAGRKLRKHSAKRSKKHGQFLGTVADSWEATRRR